VVFWSGICCFPPGSLFLSPVVGGHGSTNRTGDRTIKPFDEVFDSEVEGRVVSVVTPIYREGSCGTSGCHTEPTPSPVLGLLQADFSLQRVDDLIAQRFLHTVLAVLVSILLCSAGTWWMMDRLVGRRIRILRNGAARVARKDFDFRFRDSREDGIAQMSGTFDNMVSDLSATLSELASTKEYLQGIIESSADIIITVDPSGMIETFNRGAEEILGYRREEVIGKKIETLFADPRERDVAIARLRHTDHVVNYETHFVTKEGEKRDVILTLSRLRTPDGVPVGTFGISKDVTKEKRLQRELILKERLAAIGEAVAGIHHTLKNMLGSRRLIHTAVMDLLMNALDACEWKDYGGSEAPEVVLRAHSVEDGRHVVIEVRDNGQGMTEEIEKNIFTPFFSTKKGVGTGMGLTLASRIIRLHHGTIDVGSEPFRGSTFRISLPVGALRERKEDLDA